MSDHPHRPLAALALGRGPREDVSTEIEAVDAVVATLDGLDERPVIEHVAVFESAHESLRAALTQG